MPNNILKRILKALSATAFWILIWEAASLLVDENLRLFLPSPISVFKKMAILCLTSEFWAATTATIFRVFLGFIFGSIGGILCGILTSNFKLADILLSPALRIIRAVPVVSFIILAFLFIRVDTLPIFISFLMVVPMIWQTVHDALLSSDNKLCEMGKVFGLNNALILFKIKIPSCINEIISACVGGLGFAWKSGVAAEVLCTPAVSLGKSVYRAKANLDFAEVYALTLTVVILSLIIEFILKRLCRIYLNGRKKEKND